MARPAADNEYAKFSAALKKILSVPHAEIQAKLQAEKRRKTKKRGASRAGSAKD